MKLFLQETDDYANGGRLEYELEYQLYRTFYTLDFELFWFLGQIFDVNQVMIGEFLKNFSQ